MKYFLSLLLICFCLAAGAQEYSGTTTPTLTDTEVTLLRKVAKTLNDSRTGAAPLSSGSTSKSTTIATSKVTLSTSASVISAASTTRRSILVRNIDATISVYIGASGVSSANGFLLKAGESISIYSTAAIYGIAASATPAVNTISEND